MPRKVAGSRVEYSGTSISTWKLVKAAVYYEINHIPRRGITSKEIAERYSLGNIWYEYEGDPRRVNMVEQLIRNELNRYYKERAVVKMWNSRTGKLILRDGYIVYFKPDVFPKRQVEYGVGLPDPRRWGFQ